MKKHFYGIVFVALVLSLSFFSLAKAVTIVSPVTWIDLNDLINKLIDFIFYIALVVLPAVIMYGGFLYITAGGDPAKVSDAQKMMLWAGIGFLIMLLAKGAVALINNIFLNPPLPDPLLPLLPLFHKMFS